MSAYIAPSQIAQRQLAYFEDKNVLVIGEAEDLFPTELSQYSRSVTVFTSNYSYYRSICDNSKLTAVFGAELPKDIAADMVLLYWPKAKQEAAMLLAMVFSHLGENTEIVVVGENRSGVKSIEKMFAPYGRIQKYDSARRCSFYWGICTSQPDTFALADWFKSYTVEFAGRTLTVKSLPGVFSHGEFDLGSQLLLNHLPKLSGRVLDFGCGAGIVGLYMALTNPDIELEMCDINAFAIESSKQTLKANNLSGKVFASDVYSDVSQAYQFIVSNPPFHSGLDTSYQATETLLEKAPSYLSNKGQLYIVANSFLKYPPIINAQFGHCNVVSKNKKFSIYHATK
jgi:16S rRNA (guanine1207-N2)-methyltransferase